MNAPADTDSTSAGGSPGPDRPEDSGPRVNRDEARDLSRIRRSRTDRKIAGVAAGVARHFDIDPVLVRVAFVVLVFFGGGGVLAYAAGWLFIPEEETEDATVRLDDRSRTVVLVAAAGLCALSLVGDSFGGWDFPWPLAVVGIVVVAVLAAKGKLPAPPPPPAAPGAFHDSAATYAGYRPGPPPPTPRKRRGPLLFFFTAALAAVLVGVLGTIDLAGADVPLAAYPATVLATSGVMLLVGAFYGRAGGLILVGLVAAAATAAATVVDDVSAGRVNATPASAAALDPGYDLGMGEIRVDLGEIEDLEALDGRTLDLDLRFGRIHVIVPEDGLDVVVDADIEGAGEARVFDDRSDGSLEAAHDGGPDVPELTINADLLFGEIDVHTEEVAA